MPDQSGPPDSVGILVPSGMLGAGFRPGTITRGISLGADVIAVDGGSTDSGPYYLGAGVAKTTEGAVRRDLRLLLAAASSAGIPLVVGSCGTSGTDSGVNWVAGIVNEICAGDGLDLAVAKIFSEQQAGQLLAKLGRGRIHALPPSEPLDAATLTRCVHIVGMMGHEPIAAAIEQGAQVVLAGRASDTALFSTVPLMMGVGAGPTWHAAKILECGTACVVQRKRPDSIMAWIREDHFDVEPMDMDVHCTPQSVASHTLYENADPFLITEPDGTIDSHGARYEGLNDRAVRVHGSRFHHAERGTIKLEGAEFAGYQAIIIGGVREPFIIRQLDSWLEGMQGKFAARVQELFDGRLGPDDYDIHVRVYGRDGVMGKLEPLAHQVGHEVCLLFTITSAEESSTDAIAKTFAHFALHYPIPEWRGLISGIAFPMAPSHVNRGPVYRFNLNHVVVPDDPLEMFQTEFMEV